MPFCRGRANLARVYLLVDARHGLKPVDDGVLDTLDKAAVNYQIVLTKADQVKADDLAAASPRRRRRSPSIRQPTPRCSRPRPARVPALPELRAAIARLLEERGDDRSHLSQRSAVRMPPKETDP